MKTKSPYLKEYRFCVAEGKRLRELAIVNPEKKEDIQRLEKKFKELSKSKHAIFVDVLPKEATIYTKLENEADHGRIGSLVFSRPPINRSFFSDGDYEEIKTLSNIGIEVYWDHPSFGRLVFHDIGFMKEEKILDYERARTSNNICTCYGSSSNVSNTARKDIRDALKAFRKYIGKSNSGYVINGGGPNAMNIISEAGKENELMVGTITISKHEREKQEIRPDVFFPFIDSSLHLRLENMLSPAGVFLIFNGGVGTLEELYAVCTREKLSMIGKPMIIVGNTKLLRLVYKTIKEGTRSGQIPKSVMNCVKHAKKGSDVYDILCDYNGFPKHF